MYGADETFPLDISESAVGWSSMPICPSTNERYLTFSGTTDLRFTVEMLQEETIELDQPREVKLNARNHPNGIYQFTPTKDISDTQLDVTVTSESDVPAYLKVSRECKDVMKDNIKVVDYKGESLRLSFAKKGRITLSKFSIPPLTDSTSSWFIGIAIKNATGDTPFDAEKTVTLTLTRSFDYSYADPIGISQGAISFLLGLVVSVFAWCAFRQWPSSVSRKKCWDFFCAVIDVISIYSFGRGPKTYSYIAFIVGAVLMVGAFQFVFADWYLMIHEGDRDHCYYNDFCYRVRYADIPYNLIISNLAYVIHGLMLALNVLCMETELLLYCRKLAREEKETEMKQIQSNEGSSSTNQDQVAITESNVELLPQHVLTCPDISLHLEKMLVPKDNTVELEIFAEARKKKFSFSMCYAFAWALCFEGMFSALYHLCPSKLTFQFDTAFMFAIAGLSVVLLYNGIQMQECSVIVQESSKVAEAKRRVGAANFFLFFLVPLLIFNYFGTLYHSEAGLATAIKIPFFICLAVWFISMAVWAGCKLFPKNMSEWLVKVSSCIDRQDVPLLFKMKLNEKAYQPSSKWLNFFWYILGLLLSVVLFVLWLFKIIVFSEALLYFCVGGCAVAGLGSFWEMGCCDSNDNWDTCCWTDKPWKQRFLSSCCCWCFCGWCCGLNKRIKKIVFVGIFFILLVAALLVFKILPTTDKGLSPEKSRDLNQECFLLDFYDYHDLWHILSSFALLMWALSVTHVSYKNELPQKQKGSQTSGTKYQSIA